MSWSFENRDKHDVQGVRHRAPQREPLAQAESEREIVAQRDEAHAQDAHERGHKRAGSRPLLGDDPVDQRRHHTVDRREEGVSARRGVRQRHGLDHVARPVEDAQHDATDKVRPVQVLPQARIERGREDEGREGKADGHHPRGRDLLDGAFEHDERAAPHCRACGEGGLPDPLGHVTCASHREDRIAQAPRMSAHSARTPQPRAVAIGHAGPRTAPTNGLSRRQAWERSHICETSRDVTPAQTCSSLAAAVQIAKIPPREVNARALGNVN